MKLHIDVETYSSVDIRSSGAYAYCESVDFEVLMVAYAFDDDPVEIIDLASGETLPKEFISTLLDPDVEKHAHNANFERNVFRTIGYDIPIEQWHCSAVKAAYCGWPISLEAISEAMKLEEFGKKTTGRALIRYFCSPIRPTKANGLRHRNFWHHDIEKWDEFKAYCINDVIAEREIGKRLEHIEMPEFERKNYILDQEINDRGIRVDENMARNAQKIDIIHSSKLKDRMIQLTGLENPNSPKQLSEWLSKATKEDITSVAKDEVEALLEEHDGVVREVLELRLMSSKSSVKKYQAMENCAGYDKRVRGLFQFYGANRTGRWAGRLVQLQNLPRNYLKSLDTARKMVEVGNYGDITLAYDDISYVLSQLIRTAFIAKQGHTFAIADFSAIEARVVAWLADEQWKLDVFNSHGKIYEASAARMFKVPIEEVTPESKLRERGKNSELALGYQGGWRALDRFTDPNDEIPEPELKQLVKLWRAENKKIVSFWYAMGAAAVRAVKTRKPVVLKRYKNLKFEYIKDSLTIELPSGRSLFYVNAITFINNFRSEAIKFKGMDQATKKWWWIETYGGKLAENVTQAIARDILAYSMLRIDEEGYKIVMHVHDEVVCEVDENTAQTDFENICNIMGEEIPWAKGLPLKADGFITRYYKKD